MSTSVVAVSPNSPRRTLKPYPQTLFELSRQAPEAPCEGIAASSLQSHTPEEGRIQSSIVVQARWFWVVVGAADLSFRSYLVSATTLSLALFRGCCHGFWAVFCYYLS